MLIENVAKISLASKIKNNDTDKIQLGLQTLIYLLYIFTSLTSTNNS